ncbi:MAG: NAD-dependent deacylase [Thermoplasmata archaeon]|nr:NAD-dependent deacylase [Thermoplasmata archaeon]
MILEPGLLDRVRSAERVCVLTGAGVSAESGVQTFRGPGGAWEGHDPMRLASQEGFDADPALVWRWYRWRQERIFAAAPNAAHMTLADMEAHHAGFCLVTQNVDGLHARAGSRRVVELHGSIWRLRCPADGELVEIDRPVGEGPPRCRCGAIMRPDVVWFGERMPDVPMEAAFRAAAECQVMLVVGTSAVVYPAAALPSLAKSSGAAVIEVNVEPTPISAYADAFLCGPAAELLPAIWSEVVLPKAL